MAIFTSPHRSKNANVLVSQSIGNKLRDRNALISFLRLFFWYRKKEERQTCVWMSILFSIMKNKLVGNGYRIL